VYLFVMPPEVTAVAERFNATPFDIDDAFWSHRGPTCTFDTMLEESRACADSMAAQSSSFGCWLRLAAIECVLKRLEPALKILAILPWL
jgi:Chromate resistance exported protein